MTSTNSPDDELRGQVRAFAKVHNYDDRDTDVLMAFIETERIKAKIEELEHVFATVYDDVATDLGDEPKGLYKTVEERIAELKEMLSGKH